MNSVSKKSVNASEYFSIIAIVGRIALSALFLQSGFGKLLTHGATIAAIESAGLPFPELAYAGAALTEILGGLALSAGYRLQWTSGILAAFSIATAIAFHTNFGDPNQVINFMKNISISGGLLHVAIAGGGRFSFDSLANR